MYMNRSAFPNALFVFHSLRNHPKFTVGYVEYTHNGEEVGCGIQTFCDHFSFQLLRRNHISQQLSSVFPCIETRHPALECLPEVVTGRSGVDARHATASEPIWRKFGLPFRLGTCDVAVAMVDLVASFDVLKCSKLNREGRNIYGMHGIG
jgi:hypothetical protein